MAPITTDTPKKTACKLVPIEQIDANFDNHIRVAVDPKVVKEYRGIIKEHEHMDPVDVFRSGPQRFDLADGWHRLDAYKQEGRTEIPATIWEGSHSDALKMAITKTCHIGARATNADKRRAATMAVNDPVLGELPDAKIAKAIGVSTALVGACRRGETTQQATKKRKEKAAEKQETESAAPRPVTARQRKPIEGPTPTKARLLREIDDYLANDVLEEADLLKLMDGKDGEWKWVKKPGEKLILRVVGSSGREQIAIDAVVKEVTMDCITLRCLDGKVSYQEKDSNKDNGAE